MTRIYCAAIWYKDLPDGKYCPTNIGKGVVIEGHRHPDIIRTVLNLTGKRQAECGEYVQGFVTTEDQFVTRQEAMKIARAANQIISDTNLSELYSEDIY
jgi:predicted methyltransferase